MPLDSGVMSVVVDETAVVVDVAAVWRGVKS
jgi:hypothetical protein